MRPYKNQGDTSLRKPIATSRQKLLERTMWILLAIIGVLLCMMTGLTLLPLALRALPGRYAYYLPEPLLELRRVAHANTLPTPVIPPSPTSFNAAPPIASISTITPPPATLPATITPMPTATLTPSPTPLPISATIAGLRHERQGWNNCGPTTLAMAISYWGCTETQADIAPVLKPDPEDKNVSPEEMAAYVQTLGLEGVIRFGGDLELLKRLVAHDYPVIVETWVVRDSRDQLGHYLLIMGYDDNAQHFLTYDSLHGPDLPIGYQELDELWRVFNRLYLIIVAPESLPALMQVLGPAASERWATAHALDVARREATNPPETCVAYATCTDVETFAHFNIGTNLVAQGYHDQAAAAYDQARLLGLHYRMLWYQFGPYVAYYTVGRYEDVITLADETLRVTRNLEESYYWRARAWQALGEIQKARADFKAALRYHEGWPPAQEALEALGE